MNQYPLLVVLIALLYITWLRDNPSAELTLVAEFKRGFRRWVIQRHGTAAARLIEKELRVQAGKDRLKQKAVDIVMSQEQERIIQKFGTRYANQFLGFPDPLERDF